MSESEKTLFDALLNNFKETYKSIIITYPYESEYMEFIKRGSNEVLGGFTTEGYNLLYCVCELASIYEDELR